MAGAARRRTVAAMPATPLPRVLSAVAAALLVALMLASAGSASAAPSASSSATASCAKATKTVRTAKSRLRKAQALARRGKGSKKAIARARRALKKAQLAKGRACRPPVESGGAPPAVESGGAPPPAPSPAPGPGEPSPPPPPPPPAPGGPTSHALIQKALEEGRIDEETALEYRVFAEFGDSRLPEEFRGSPLEVTDTATLDEVAERWDELSAATREALDPFFIPPFNPGSWYELGSATALRVSARAASADAAAPRPPGSDLCTSTAPDMSRWGYVTAAGSKVRVWYENTVAGQEAKAISVAEYLDSGPWAKVTGLFREPLQDGGDLIGKRCRGFDPAVDIVLTGGMLKSGSTIAYEDKGKCGGPIPGFYLVRRDLTGKALQSTVVHELAHLTQYAYSSGNECNTGISWLSEATAAWTENYVGGFSPEHPEVFAPYFFDRPNLPLETYEPDSTTTTPRQYGAYLFFQWLAKNKGADAVSKVWKDTESGAHPIDTLQQTLTGLGFSDGFEEAWKRFALAGLNPLQQVDWFKQWGLPRGADIDGDRVFSDDAGKKYPVALPHLSAEYHRLDFSEPVKTVQVTNELAGVAGASVQLWLRIDDGGEERVEVRDISGEETTTFCRELPAENVQEIALVIANSTHANRTHVLEGDVSVKGRPTCGNWDATTKTTIESNGLTEVYIANYTLAHQWTAPRAGGGTESFFLTEGAYNAHASWSISGVSESDGCTYSGSATWPAGTEGLQAQLTLRDAGKGNPETTYDVGFGYPFKAMLIRRSACPDGYSGDVYWPVGLGFASQPHPWDPTDDSIIGSETQDLGGVKITREWTLSRNAIAP